MFSVLQVSQLHQNSIDERDSSPHDTDDMAVSTVNSVDEAHLKISSGSTFDCIVCHDETHGEDGLQLLKTLRKTGNTTPFIMITGEDDEEITRSALQLGAHDVLNRKSVTPETVRMRIERLKQAKSHQSSRTSPGQPASTVLGSLQERIELLEKKEQEYDQLLHLMAHDFKEQINTINEFARILEEDFDELSSEDARRHLKLITKSSGRVKRTISILQDYQKAQLSKIQPHEVNLSVITSSLLDDLSTSYAGRIARICVASDITVTGDEALLHLCMDYMLRTAWKRTLKRKFTEITFGSYRDQNSQIFFLSNNGEALSYTERELAMSPFDENNLNFFSNNDSLGDDSSTISLAIVDRIIQRHGGKLWFEKNDAGSTTFLFTLSYR